MEQSNCETNGDGSDRKDNSCPFAEIAKSGGLLIEGMEGRLIGQVVAGGITSNARTRGFVVLHWVVCYSDSVALSDLTQIDTEVGCRARTAIPWCLRSRL